MHSLDYFLSPRSGPSRLAPQLGRRARKFLEELARLPPLLLALLPHATNAAARFHEYRVVRSQSRDLCAHALLHQAALAALDPLALDLAPPQRNRLLPLAHLPPLVLVRPRARFPPLGLLLVDATVRASRVLQRHVAYPLLVLDDLILQAILEPAVEPLHAKLLGASALLEVLRHTFHCAQMRARGAPTPNDGVAHNFRLRQPVVVARIFVLALQPSRAQHQRAGIARRFPILFETVRLALRGSSPLANDCTPRRFARSALRVLRALAPPRALR